MNVEIIKNIESGVFRVSKRKPNKSKVWDIFSQIENHDSTVIDGVVICGKCNTILKYNGKQTSNLIRHRCYKEKDSNVPLIKVSTADKENFLTACAEWVVQDCRPFSIVDGEGFKKVLQSTLNIGKKYVNHLDISDMIPDSRTISRRISEIADEKRQKLKEALTMPIASGTASITCDLWTDNFVKRQFLCVTFHFTKDSKLTEIVLGVKSMDFQRCTAINVLAKMKSILQDFGITSMENIVFVTDRGSNIVKALEEQTRINCANHLLNNVLDSAFNSTVEIIPFFDACKKLVKYFKKTNLQHMLSTSLKNYCVTRWNSHLSLFQSISNNFMKIQEILTPINETHRISEINISLLLALVEMFENFDIISKKLQGVNYVTINYVYLTINSFKAICEENSSDMEVIKTLKRNILQQMETKYVANLNIIHYAACFLYPPTNFCLETTQLNLAKQYCVSEIMKSTPSPDNSVISPTSVETPKDFQLFFSPFAALGCPSITESIQDEVSRYSYLKVGVDLNFDVLQWWENHSSEYPRLYKFAQRVLSVPASSAASERVFSAAGNIITEKRNRIGPKTVNNLIFLNSLYKIE